MAAANCSPAVASRRAKYVNEFRVQTLLGAKPTKIAQKELAADAQFFSDGSLQSYSAVPERKAAPPRSQSVRKICVKA
jgi:hypothetical protein